MVKRILAATVAALLGVWGLQTPAVADETYDFAVSVVATANTTTVPSVLTWTITVSSVGDDMGQGGGQEGLVEFTAPSNTISLVISGDCDTDGYDVSCAWLVEDNADAVFEVHGLLSLLAVGTITVTPAFTANAPRSDSNSANDSDSASCTAITSLLVTC